MTIHSPIAAAAAAHLLASAAPLRTKNTPGDPLDVLAQKFGAHVSQVLEKLGATNDELNGVKTQLFELEQKAGRASLGGGHYEPETWGAAFTKSRSAELQRLSSERGRTSFEIKATITSATTDANGSAGGLVIPHRDQLVMMPKRRLAIRNLLNVVQVSSGSVEYPEQTGRVNNAAMVAEGGLKPQSDLKFDMKTVPIRTIAHWMKASKQILEDSPQLRDFIDQELRYGLALVEEGQILYGDGTGQNLTGMVSRATGFAAPMVIADANEIDKIGLAILQASLTNTPPDGIVIHPSDWWRMRLTKDADGKYLLGDPQTAVQPSLFGLPVVTTEAMTADKFLVGSFQSQTLYDRWEARVEVGFENDDFTRNLVTILGEERIGLATKRPEALIYGDFGNVA
ncbi:phage major capsid protein [Agrobacterium vitis]|uniref:Phage major capsid protein n=1 Tax=Agrobacterium vitis TaxID=373 RepID=A0AAE4WEV6_AGRVI|nr:phage major capsid protein [Agrobacterium vitis]MCF1501205.1 phage major capsid protein [Allorhizobium sp. Av2]MCM2440565.1 phage major capsid protein [Agrobacterium vitis]MUZ59551.1 phage major capsid protein [Agrobacterium vitis]MVA66687.1 phage major capsid protein [Agrobacterium vitis]MVA87550.1 phage major capsid protein [Agrobacterium vitis]